MTDTIAIVLMASLAAAVSYTWLRYQWAQRELERLRGYEFFADKFFHASRVLASESDTPAGLIDVIETFNSMIADREGAKMFFDIYHRRARENIEGKLSRGTSDPELSEFTRRHPQLECVIQDAIMGAVLALSFLDTRRGTQNRALLAELSVREHKPTVVLDAIKETKHHDGMVAAAA